MESHLSPDQAATSLPAGSTATSHTDLNSLKEKDFDIGTPDNRNSFLSTNTAVDEEKAVTPPETDATKTPEQAPDEERIYKNWTWLAVCIAMYITAFLYGLDNTIVADVQGAVVEEFGEVNKLGWLGIGFSLGSVATILSQGKAYGLFDMKWLYIASIVMFEAGSALCGGAPTMNALIFGRIWAGVGGAGMYLG